MRIGIDATALSPKKTGTVTYLTEILACWQADLAIEHQFFIFCTKANQHHFEMLQGDERFVLVTAPSAKLKRILWQQTVLPWYLWHKSCDVHWGPTFVLPLIMSCPSVVSIHDLTFEMFPELHEPIKRYYFPWMIRRAVNRAKAILTISQSTANDLERLIKQSCGKTHVTLLAATRHESENHDARLIEQPYVLFIGTVEPRKNLLRLLQAWKSLSDIEKSGRLLVVIGAIGWMVDEVRDIAQDDPTVKFVGHVSDEQLTHYLQQAEFFVYPSLYEGFGLPVLEAMVQGVAVMTSNVGATKEVAGQAALLVNPESVSSMKDGLLRLLTDSELRGKLGRAGLERAAQFSWAQTAAQTLSVITDSASRQNP